MKLRSEEHRLFISYAHRDLPAVKALYSRLSKAGFRPWMDSEDIPGGSDWLPTIEDAVRQCTFFLAFLSTNSVDRRGMVQREIKLALEVWQEKLDDDIYLIPVRINDCRVPKALARFQWIDLFAEDGFERLVASLKAGFRRLGIISLRATASEWLESPDIVTMLKERDFFDSRMHPLGDGLLHDYEVREVKGEKVILDHATGLTWQQAGPDHYVTFEEAPEYVQALNEKGYCGFVEWRLPTLEEAMSLLQPKSERGMYIGEIFGHWPDLLWTSDLAGYLRGTRCAWGVSYGQGCCWRDMVTSGQASVRAVR